MPKYKTRNTLHWITWEGNTACYWKVASLCHITKENISSKTPTKNVAWKLVLAPFKFAKD